MLKQTSKNKKRTFVKFADGNFVNKCEERDVQALISFVLT